MSLPWVTDATVFGAAWLAWFLAGRKGRELLKRSPMILLWSSCEEVAGIIFGCTLVQTFGQQDWQQWSAWLNIGIYGLCAIAGCLLGGLTSGVVQWRK